MKARIAIAVVALAVAGVACASAPESDPVAEACAERVGVEDTGVLAKCIYEAQRILDGKVTTTTGVPGAARMEAGSAAACAEKRFTVDYDEREVFADVYADKRIEIEGHSALRSAARAGCLRGLRGY